MCIARALVDELLALPLDAKASDVIHRYIPETVYVEVPDPAVVTDVDDPAAYAELLARADHEDSAPGRAHRAARSAGNRRDCTVPASATVSARAFEAALETALNRPVHIGAVHLNLFHRPRLHRRRRADRRRIQRRASSRSPTSSTCKCAIGLTSLFAGKLAFSSLRLDTPSVNVVKTAAGPWNIQPLLDRRPSPGSARPAVPDIQIRGGRVELQVRRHQIGLLHQRRRRRRLSERERRRGDALFRIARAHRPRLPGLRRNQRPRTAAFRFQAPKASSAWACIWTAPPSPNWSRLFNARDLGVHGYVLANAKLDGPLSHIDVTGDLNISDVHRWDLMPSPDQGWTLNYRGYLNLNAHELQLETVAASAPAPPVAIRFRLDGLSDRAKMGRRLHLPRPPRSVVGGNRPPPGCSASGRRAWSTGRSRAASATRIKTASKGASRSRMRR